MALSQRGDCDIIPKSSAMTFLSCLALVVSELETPLPHSATHKRQHFTACLGIGRRGEGGLRCKNTLFRVHTPTTLSQRQSKNRLQKKRWFFTELKKLTKKSIRVVLQEPSLVSFTLCAYPGLGLALMRHQWPHYEVGACWHDSSCGKAWRAFTNFAGSASCTGTVATKKTHRQVGDICLLQASDLHGTVCSSSPTRSSHCSAKKKPSRGGHGCSCHKCIL